MARREARHKSASVLKKAPYRRGRDTGQIIAAEPTSEDVDDGSQVGPDRLRRLLAMGRTIGTKTTVRSAGVIRMRRSLCRPVRARCQAQRQRPGRPSATGACSLSPSAAAWTGSGLLVTIGRALVKADIGCYKHVIGDALRSRTEGR